MTTRKRPARAKPRKPNDMHPGDSDMWTAYATEHDFVSIDSPWGGFVMRARHCRRLAAWLLKAADWLEAQGK